MPQLVWKDVTVAEPVDASTLAKTQPLPPPSSQVLALLASYPPPSLPRPVYCPLHSTMANFLGAQGCNSGQTSSTNSIMDNSQNQPHNQSSGLARTPPSTSPSTASEDVGHAPPSTSSNEPSRTPPSTRPSTTSEDVGHAPLCTSSNEPCLPSSNASNNQDSTNTPHGTSAAASSTFGQPEHMSSLAGQQPDFANTSPAGSTSPTAAPPLVGPSPTAPLPVGPSPSSSVPLNSTDDRSISMSGHLNDSGPEPGKKKRSEMGPAEQQLVHQASANRSKKLGAAIGDLLEEQEALFAKTAEDNNISAARVKRLANQAPSLKPKKKVSDYNILFFYKNKELNGDRPSGSKLSSKLIHDAVQKDKELQEIRKSESAMAELRKRYMEDKDDEDVATILAHIGFKSTAIASYFGRGPVDEFLRSEFGVGIQVFTQHFETWLLARNAKLSKKMSVTDMAKDLTRIISRGLSEITGIKDISMNYASYEASICVPYHVAVKDWPSSVPWSYPQKLAADEVRALYTSWTDGKTHWYHLTATEHRTLVCCLDKDGKLDPKEKRKRKAASASAPADEDSDDNSTQSDSSTNNNPRPTKKSKSSRASSSKTASKTTSASRKTSSNSKKQNHSEGSVKRKSKGKEKAVEKKKKKSGKSKKSVRFIADDDEVEEDENHSSYEESDVGMTTSVLASISPYRLDLCIATEIPVRMHINSKQFGAKLSKLHVYQVLITFVSIFPPPEANQGF
ncbi:hypothetical protein EV361DRAFT_977894 [Lentinula raphanica]|nr:hypothetical protein EV361DRAFT_977894 [Lentinula raphanica]